MHRGGGYVLRPRQRVAWEQAGPGKGQKAEGTRHHGARSRRFLNPRQRVWGSSLRIDPQASWHGCGPAERLGNHRSPRSTHIIAAYSTHWRMHRKRRGRRSHAGAWEREKTGKAACLRLKSQAGMKKPLARVRRAAGVLVLSLGWTWVRDGVDTAKCQIDIHHSPFIIRWWITAHLPTLARAPALPELPPAAPQLQRRPAGLSAWRRSWRRYLRPCPPSGVASG